ncbi:Sec-independent protein translocase protein TatB [Allorhizobium sp. BGMRC 0089]|uniref:Sec-independent protein translocase protein TatB n=1 Tax=Allorhizobium sonneratiae TaxID=2934936 RepID=UPI002034254F|nr:Sec-independent protein translocase protein TatB [Allorhizobium sonneratiae]MCM2293658.1 Sec-independent protein translocase protein TatB [Allorhizobium sonneratiae]
MLDIGWSELLIIAIVMIVVVGPKDLPPMLRAFGKMTSRLRRTAADFRAQFDEALREADLDDVRRTIHDARSLNPANALREAINPLRQMGADLKSDLQRATQVDHFPEDEGHDVPLLGEPAKPMGPDDVPPLAAKAEPSSVKPAQVVSQAPQTTAEPVVKADPVKAGLETPKPATKRAPRKVKSAETATAETTQDIAAASLKKAPAKPKRAAASARPKVAVKSEAASPSSQPAAAEVKPATVRKSRAKTPVVAEDATAPVAKKTATRKKAAVDKTEVKAAVTAPQTPGKDEA